MNPIESWNRAVQEGKDQFRARLEALRERREWLEHQYANGMQTETSAQERTANACEKILSHFEGGRF
jgi:predicted  nucleic acid-binding Zn-ribbon protein